MKKFFFLPLLAIFAVAFGVYWFYLNAKAPLADSSEFEDFLIVKGSGAAKVANNLYEAGLIKSPLAFKIYVQVSGKAGKIQAGEYRLSPSFNLFELLNQLGKGPSEIWVTVPEGLRREEVARRFSDSLGKDEVFVEEFLGASSRQEGYLFPDTYLFPKTASASAIVARMVDIFESKTTELNLTSDQVILASLIERETKTDAERGLVSGIMMNRLDIGMALQIDASVQYAVGDSSNWWPILTRDDIAVNSPYNTYRFAGIPPGPIASPGLSSLTAAANPEESDYLYYIHDDSGQIYYARTLEEHNANVNRYLR